MVCVSDAAGIVLKSTLNSIDTRSTRYARLSYLQDIMHNTSQTCSLSGKTNWGVASRLNQISHEASKRLHKGLGSGVEVRYYNQNSIVSIPQHSNLSQGFAFSKFIMARGVHLNKFRFGGRGKSSFGITRPFSYDTACLDSRTRCALDLDVRSSYPGGPGGWQHKGLINTVLFGNECSNLLVGRGVHSDSFEELEIPDVRTSFEEFIQIPNWRLLRDSVLTLKLDMGEDGTDGKLSLYRGDNFLLELIGGLRGGFVWIAQLGPACLNEHPMVTVGKCWE